MSKLEGLKALTVSQPWANLIAAGHKPYEFRSWKPPAKMVGQRIAIHAGSRRVQAQEIKWLIAGLGGYFDASQRPALKQSALDYLIAMSRPGDYVRGAFVCTVTLGEPVRGDECARELGIPAAVNDSDREGTFNWGWPMLDVTKVINVPCRGAQGLWNVPKGLL